MSFVRFWRSIVAIAALLPAFAAEYKLKWSDQHVEAAGFEASTLRKLRQSNWSVPEWQRLLSVYAEQSDPISDLNLPPMIGSYRVEGNTVQFHPKFPLEPGVNYRAVFRPAALGAASALAITSTQRLPAPETKATTVVSAVYPSVDKIPENLLKFYLYFSAPMSGGHIYDFIELRESTGKKVELPFLEIDEELWDRTMTRLTLFLDPGRIKRGVKPLEEIGPSFQAGKSYTLTIRREWRDANGAPLKTDFAKKFEVIAADREPPDPGTWKVASPRTGSRNPAKVTFDEPLDHALANRILRIADSSGHLVEGQVELNANDREWLFTPAQPWKAGAFEVQIPTLIEDLAGNNIGKPFDVDLQIDKRRMTNSLARLSFTVR